MGFSIHTGVVAGANRNRGQLDRPVRVGQVEDGNETGFSNDARRTIQSADLDEDGFPVRRRHCVLQGRTLAKLPTCREYCFAIHYPIPDGWMNPNFDDSKWPRAFEYLDQEVGIVGVPGYWRYPEAFMGARWIWTISLVFDNTVLLRKTVR